MSSVVLLVLVLGSFAIELLGRQVEQRAGRASVSVAIGGTGNATIALEAAERPDPEMIARVRALAAAGFPGRRLSSRIDGNRLGPAFALATIEGIYDPGPQPSLALHPKAMRDALARFGLASVDERLCPPGGVDMVVTPPRHHSIEGDCTSMDAAADVVTATLYPQPSSWWRTLAITGVLALLALAAGATLLRSAPRASALLSGVAIAGTIVTFFWVRDPSEVTVTGRSAVIGDHLQLSVSAISSAAALLFLVLSIKRLADRGAGRGPHPPPPG